MSIFENIFSNIQKFAASTLAGLASMYAPTYAPILALTFITIINAFYAVRVNVKNNKRKTGLNELKKMSYKIRDSIVAICGAFTIEKFIITSINLHAVEFVAGAIALIEFWTLIENLGQIHPNWKVWGIFKKVIKKKGEEILDVKLEEILPDDANNKNNS